MDNVLKMRLSTVNGQVKALNFKKMAILKELADPEKNQRTFEVSKTIYRKILDTTVEDSDLNLKDFMGKVFTSIDESEHVFFESVKYKQFYKRKELFEFYNISQEQKDLVKAGYLGLRMIQKCRTLNQFITCIAEAKINQHKDILINEYLCFKKKESLRASLFKKQGFDKVKDLNKRELLLELKSNPELTQKSVIAKLGIPPTTAKNWISDFKKLGLI